MDPLFDGLTSVNEYDGLVHLNLKLVPSTVTHFINNLKIIENFRFPLICYITEWHQTSNDLKVNFDKKYGI